MKSLMNKAIKSTILLAILSTTLSSCFVNRTTVGNGPINKEDTTVVYSQVKQYYLILGLAALNKAQPKLPAEPNYQVISYMSLTDGIITGCTFGVVCARTTKILVKKPNSP